MLASGAKAVKSLMFSMAAVYLNLGIDLLGDKGWRDDYVLTLALHNASAEMEMCSANFQCMKSLSRWSLHV